MSDFNLSLLLTCIALTLSTPLLMTMVHGENIFLILFIPGLAVWSLLDNILGIDNTSVLIVGATLGQISGYFMGFYYSLKFLRYLGYPKADNIDEEQSEKE